MREHVDDSDDYQRQVLMVMKVKLRDTRMKMTHMMKFTTIIKGHRIGDKA